MLPDREVIFLVGSREWYGLEGLLAGLAVVSCGAIALVGLEFLAMGVLVVDVVELLSCPS